MSLLVWSKAELPPDWAMNIVEHMGLAVFIKDRSYRWVVLNQAFAELIGLERESMLGATDFDMFPHAEATFFRSKDVEMFTTGKTVHIADEQMTDGKGVVHRLATTKAPLRNAAGEVTHLIGIISDISALKGAEEQLKRANEDLEDRVASRTHQLKQAQKELLRADRLAMLGRLAGGLAHQIRNPLAAILNANALLRKQTELSPEALESLRMIEEEAWSANRIISGLVDIARPREPAFSSHSLRHVLKEVLTRVRPPGTVRATIEVPDVNIEVDEGQLISAICNIVQNAYDAMPAGGELSVKGHVDGDYVVLLIADTGPGVDAAIVTNLFEPLVTSKPLGLGLGLTTAQSIIEQQHGSLKLVHHGGQGALFSVSLKLSGDSAEG